MDDLDALIDNLNTAQTISNTSINEDIDITTNDINKSFEKTKSNSLVKCKNCGSNSLVYNHDTAMLICQNCGVCDQSNSYSDESMDQDQSTYSISKIISNKPIFKIKGLTNAYSRNLQLWNSVDYNARNMELTLKFIFTSLFLI